MTWSRAERLYNRLPELFRRRDREQGEPLRALLAIAESQLEALEDDVADLYESWFIETGPDWVVPYLADLLGIRVLGDLPHAGAHPRTQVAHALEYRQRKGTPAVLERVTRDVVGWPARVVEFFEHLAHTQTLGHVRPGQGGTFDLRRGATALAAADNPFARPSAFRSADVRRIASHRGRFNIPDLGIYLWRLQAFPVDDSPAAAADFPEGFFFDPLGRDVPLFNRLAAPGGAVRQPAETDLPVPVSLGSLDRDLREHRRRQAAADPARRPLTTGFYGPGLAFQITTGPARQAVDPFGVTARNLDSWGAVGLLSGTLTAVTAASPQVEVTLAGEGPHVARLGRAPSGVADAAALLEAALRKAHDSPRFAAARVIPAGSRLLVISGSPGDRVAVEPAGLDATTAGQLGFGAGPGAVPAQAALSGELTPFPVLVDDEPALTVTIGAAPPATVTLSGRPRDLAHARLLLEEALQAAGVLARAFTLGERLMILAADPSQTVRVAPAGTDLAAYLLDLASAVVVDPERGRMLFASAPALPVRVSSAYGFAAEIGGGPYDRRALLTDPATVAEVIMVAKGSPVPSLDAALGRWTAGGRRDAAIRIADNELYEEDFEIVVPRGVRLAIEAADGRRPVFRPPGRPRIEGEAGDGPAGSLVLNGLLVDGGLDVDGSLDLEVAHTTLVPQPRRSSLGQAGAGGAAALSVRITSSIVGVLGFGQEIASLRLEDSILDASTGGSGASPLPVLVSGPLPFDTVRGEIVLSIRLEMGVTLGTVGPVTARLRKAPADLREARVVLQEALRAAGSSASFTGAEVLVIGSHLLVRSGRPRVAVAFDNRPTVELLALTSTQARPLTGILSGDLSPFPTSVQPQVRVTLEGDGPHTVRLAYWDDAAEAAQSLQTAIRAARSGEAFRGAEVAVIGDGPHGDRLLVRPGRAGADVAVSGLSTDPLTLDALGFAPPLGAPEGTFVQGVFSGLLDPFPSLQGAELAVTFGAAGTRTVALSGSTRTVGDVAAALRAGLRAADADPAFAAADALVLDGRLLVLPGRPTLSAPPRIAGTSGDPDTVRELAFGLPPAENVFGLLSAAVAAVPVLAKPEVQATVGALTRTVSLERIPGDAGAARDLLEAALRTAGFAAAEVLLLGDRMLVRSAGAAVSFAATPADATTAAELELVPGEQLRGLLSGAIAAFPQFPLPVVEVGLGGGARGRAVFTAFPQNLDETRALLEEAIRTAGTGRSFAAASVFLLTDPADASRGRLLVLSGKAGGEAVEVKGPADDPLTAVDLQLLAPEARMVKGLLSGNLAPFPDDFRAELRVTLGAEGPHIVSLGGLPGTLDRAAEMLRTGLRARSEPAFQQADVLRVGSRLLVLSGVLGAEVQVEPSPGTPGTADLLKLRAPEATRTQGRLSGDLAAFPAFVRARVMVQLGSAGPHPVELVDLPVTLTVAAAELQVRIRAVPGGGATFSGAAVGVHGNRLLIRPGVEADAVVVTAAAAPEEAAAGDLALVAGQSEAVLVSGDLASFAGLPGPQVLASFGGTSAPATLGALPADLAATQGLLQTALQGAGFVAARVLTTTDNRLLVLSSSSLEAPSFAAAAGAAGDATTAAELKLTAAAGAASHHALLSGSLTPFPTLTAPAQVGVTFGSTTGVADLGATLPTDLASARTRLEAAIRAITPAQPTFQNARVFVLGDQLVVIPGVAGDTVSFQVETGSTAATLLELTTAAGAQSVRGLLSGAVSPFPAPLSAAPAISVTVGSSGPTTRTFTALPATLAAVRGEVEAALQAVAPAGVTVAVELAGGRLLVRSGATAVIFSNAAGRPATATALLLPLGAGGSRALLSGALPGFSGLSAMPRIGVEIGGTSGSSHLARVPADLATARTELQAAIRRANPGASFTGAAVQVVESRLLVTPGNASDPVRLTDVTPGPPTATRLALSDALSRAVDGLLSGVVTLPTLALGASIGVGGSRTLLLDHAPSDVVRMAAALQAALRAAGAPPTASAAFAAASVIAVDNQLVVLPGVPNEPVVFSAAGTPDLAEILKLAPNRSSEVEALLSGELQSPPDLRLAPSFDATLGSAGPFRAVLTASPRDFAEAAVLLQAALRAAAPTVPTFAGATVRVLGSRLLVTAGNPADSVVLRDRPTGVAPVAALGLGNEVATPATGLLSGDLVPFPVLSAAPRFDAVFGGTTRRAVLTELPGDLPGYASALESALRRAGGEAAFTGATVRLLGGRLLVQPGTRDGLPVSFADLPARPAVAAPLGLIPGTPLDALLSGALTGYQGLSGSRPRVDVAIGGQGSRTLVLDEIPATLAALRTLLERALQAAHTTETFKRATVQVVGHRLLITPGAPADSILFSAAPGRPDDVAALGLESGSLLPAGGLLSGPVSPLPQPGLRLSVKLGSQGPADVELARFPADLAEAATLLESALRGSGAGSHFAAARAEVVADRLRVWTPGVPGAEIEFEAAASDTSTVLRLRLDADNTEVADGLLSGDLSRFPASGDRPVFDVRIGAEGPYPAELPFLPFTPEEARQSLEQAIRSAFYTPAFTQSRVVLAQDEPGQANPGYRLVVLPGRIGEVEIRPETGIPADLRLTGSGGARSVNALVSSLLPPAVTLTSTAPEVRVTLQSAARSVPAFDAALTPTGSSLSALAAALQRAVRAGSSDPAARRALAIAVGPTPESPERLAVVPGEAGFSIGLGAAEGDSTTVAELQIEVGRAVGSAFSDEDSGPPMSLVRSTVLGRLVLRELPLASETLFTEPVRIERRHVGCVRYSYLPEGSQTPRRFRCQPDMALELAVRQALEARARELGLATAEDLPAEDRARLEAFQRNRVLAALAPRFTSTRYGDPGYAQLRLDSAREILTGAEDGSEIGAFSHLREPLRRRQLATLLEEYLRFGLDAGIFFLT